MKSNELLSVIVPVYGAEIFLQDCIDSILNQTYKNLEVILIDDESPDNCGKIIDDYAVKDVRIRAIHQKNAGNSSTRNNGIELATGKYITFVDNDDIIAPDMYRSMLDAMEENHLDIISCGGTVFKTGDKIVDLNANTTGKVRIYQKADILEMILKDDDNNVWNKIFRREVIGNVRFIPGRRFDDTSTTYRFVANMKTDGLFGKLDRKYYYYRNNPSSIVHTSFSSKLREDYLLGYIERLEFAKSHKLNCLVDCEALLAHAILSYLTAVYAWDEKPNPHYMELLLSCRHDQVIAHPVFNSKYRLFFKSAGRCDFIHKVGAKVSKWSKFVKQALK